MGYEREAFSYALRSDVDRLRADVRADFAALRSELNAADLRARDMASRSVSTRLVMASMGVSVLTPFIIHWLQGN